MLTLILFLSSVLHLLITTITANNAPPDYYLLNCGTDYNTTSMDGRSWEGNTGNKFAQANTDSIFTSSNASGQTTPIPQVPYMTALVCQNTCTQFFPLLPGPKFLRLYFYPTTYSSLEKSTSFFNVTVTANDYTLLKNFNPFFTDSNLKQDPIIKEFVLHVSDHRYSLSLTFSPSPNSHAFINGIEIFPIPDNYYIREMDYSIPFVGQMTPFYIYKTTALEALYRFNVGGNNIQVTEDTGMFRSWAQDGDYLLGGTLGYTPHRNIPITYTYDTPNYSAPKIVYNTARTMNNESLQYNMTWTFPVDAGFYYLLRLYFCEFLMEITNGNQRVFTIYINNQTAEEEADVIKWSNGNGIPVYREYVVRGNVDSNNGHGKSDLWLSMRPNMMTSPQYGNAILNGLEIFKLNGSDGSLADPNLELKVTTQSPPATIFPAPGKAKRKSMIFTIIGGVLGSITVVSILVFFVFRRRRIVKNYAKSSYEPSGFCRRFSLAEIKSATRNFVDNFVIGKGGFGNVYKGYIDNGATAVAIKRLNPTSNQGVREFETEIELLSRLRHLHLVSLIGYCDENGEMVLVYDYMANGTLRDHLYKTKKSPLSWMQRLQICIGSARGLHYLHTGAKPMIIHRDVKSTNILLDEKFVAKVSDFGLSKMGPVDVSHTHISTAVKGSFGYLDPEYYKRRQLTDKSDVYSFGVVLFEVLCGRPAIIPELPWEQVNLAEWARKSYEKGKLMKIIDPHLKGEILPECLAKFGEIAYSCLRDQGIERPRMIDIVWNLEFVLQLQVSADKMEQNGDASGMRTNNHAQSSFHGDAIKTEDDTVSESIEGGVSELERNGILSTPSNYKFKSQSIFSEIINPTGR